METLQEDFSSSFLQLHRDHHHLVAHQLLGILDEAPLYNLLVKTVLEI
jgi:hypothetical protein